MILFYSVNGNLIKLTPEHVYQGSDAATTLYFVAPIPDNATVSVAFTLPNGERSAKHPLTVYADELNGVTDAQGNNFTVWSYDLNDYETAYAGNLTAQFFITLNGGIIRSTQAVNIIIEQGVAPIVDSLEPSQYDELIGLMQELALDLSENYYNKTETNTLLNGKVNTSNIDQEFFNNLFRKII